MIFSNIDSAVKGSEEANKTASIYFSTSEIVFGNFTILFCFAFFIYFCFIKISSKSLSCLIKRFPSFTKSKDPANKPALPDLFKFLSLLNFSGIN